MCGFCIFIIAMPKQIFIIASLSIITLLLFSRCVRVFEKERVEVKPIKLSFSGRSALFNEDNFDLRIDSLNNQLCVRLIGKETLKKFPFPKDKNGEDLTGTAFTFELYYNNKPLACTIDQSSKAGCNTYFRYSKWLSKTITYLSDTIDLKSAPMISFEIPFYALHQLKRGPKEIELRGRQTLFCSANTYRKAFTDSSRKDTTWKDVRNYSKTSLLSFSAKFKIQMPSICRSTLYGQGIELRNDSVYSPAGMDNTIWNSSYPDIYWTIDYPNREFYCSSDYQTSTAHYDIKDTFCLFHYTPNDSIYIGVWDHDNLSRDDYISYKRFSLNQFPQNKNWRFAFQNIKTFGLKVTREGIINK